MNFREKLDSHFQRFTVSTPNYSLEAKYLFADYIELISLFSNTEYISLGDILDRLADEGKIILEEESPDPNEIGSTSSAKKDEAEFTVRKYFLELEQRSYLFGDFYPFEYSEHKIKLKKDLNYKHELYLMLLVSSKLNQFGAFQTELTTEFEIISFYALKKFLPPNALIKKFGKNSDYTGTAIEKIKDLANDLNLNTDNHEIDQITKGNTQERGLDLIGWIPFEDQSPNMIIILAQCACGKNWPDKNHDTSRFKNYFRFYKSKPIQSLFIPYSLIDYNQSRFYSSDEIEEGCLVFERKRLIEYFDAEDEFNNLDSKQIIQKCLLVKEDIV